MKLSIESPAPDRPVPGRSDRQCGDQCRRPPQYIFVGERRSQRAIRLGVRWEDGRLAARTLHAALRAAGIDPGLQMYRNVFGDDEPRIVNPAVLAELRVMIATGAVVVGMGRAVQAALTRTGIPHVPLVHPAARGAIRARSAYHAHVAAVLGQARPPRTSDRVADGCQTRPGMEPVVCR